MNERIKELWKQSQTRKEVETFTEGIFTIRVTDNYEKFAELIIRECAEVADNADVIRQKWEGIGKYVREHFGVEE